MLRYIPSWQAARAFQSADRPIGPVAGGSSADARFVSAAPTAASGSDRAARSARAGQSSAGAGGDAVRGEPRRYLTMVTRTSPSRRNTVTPTSCG